ncbi:unnamed protein product, partial [Allacma fusca]
MKAVIVLALIVVASAAVPSRPKAVNRINTASIPFSNGPRFVGGEKAGEREFPFAVSIQITIGGAIDIYERPDDVQVIEAAGIKIHESYNYPEAVCKRDYSRIGVDITENMICASAPGRSTCDGDWGGVLIAKDEARRPYLAGV